MKNISINKQIFATVVLLTLIAGFETQAVEGNTNAAPVEVVRKSVFNDSANSGKDPFFPKSTRRVERAPATPDSVIAPIVQLSLKGISGPLNRRFALINNQPLGVGETAFVRISGGQIKVRCWEIREKSVVISVEGDPERKELRLREGL